MTSAHNPNNPKPQRKQAEDLDTERIKSDIERSRGELATTIGELESRLSAPQIRSAVRAELEHVEQRVRVTVKDQLSEAKEVLHAELGEARKAVHEGLD